MKERFCCMDIRICTVDIVEKGVFKPDLSYPLRYCVIDKEQEIAIDVETELKYDYVRTVSNLYFINSSHEKIKENKRVAMLPEITFNNLEYKERSVNIINKLKKGERFIDGNEVYNNQEYLEYINQEKRKKSKQKTKKLGKRRK